MGVNKGKIEILAGNVADIPAALANGATWSQIFFALDTFDIWCGSSGGNRKVGAGGYQPVDATLTAFAALTIAANSLTIGTGADAFSQTTFAANTFPARSSSGNLVAKTITDFGLSLVDDADAAAARTTLALGTLATQSGTAYVSGGTDVALADGGTGASLSDPGANKLWGWDDTDNAIGFWIIGSGLSYDHSTHTLSASGGGGGSPGGSNTYVQYNDSSSFGGDANFTWSKGNQTLTVTGKVSQYPLVVEVPSTSLGVRINYDTNTFTTVLGSAAGAGQFTDGTRSVTLANGGVAAQFTDGTRFVQFGDGSFAICITAGNFQFQSGGNIETDTSTGTKIGTAANQLLGFYGAATVVQPATTGTTSGFTQNSGSNVNVDSVFTGNTGSAAYTIGDVVKALKDLGLLAA